MSDLLTELAALAHPMRGLARGFDDAQATLNAAIRELQASRKLIADLRALHAPFRSAVGLVCAHCSPSSAAQTRDLLYPCPTVRMIDDELAAVRRVTCQRPERTETE